MAEEKKLISEGDGYAPRNPRTRTVVPFPNRPVKPISVTINKPKPTRVKPKG